MKYYSTFSIAARLIALLAFTVGLTIGSGGAVHAQDGMSNPTTSDSDSHAKSDKTKQIPCAGPARIPCIRGMVCVDDATDNCDPGKDGLDCKGFCVALP